MKNFIKEFYHTLTTPEEWSTGSLLAVGFAGGALLCELAAACFDVM